MSRYFGVNGEEAFVFFSAVHWSALAILFFIYLALYLNRKRFQQARWDHYARWTIAILLIVQEISLSVWRISIGTWTAGSSLPLHLCGFAILLAAVGLINRNYTIYELVYFWGLGGAIQALLTPDIGEYGYPHYRFFQFFVSHGLLILASLYMTWVGGMRPTHRSVWKAWIFTNIYMLPIALFNWITDGNYLFICHKPENGSIMDFFGPWPWYILVLEVVGIVSFYIYYAPFAVIDLKQKFSKA